MATLLGSTEGAEFIRIEGMSEGGKGVRLGLTGATCALFSPMDRRKIDLLLQYALAVAGGRDSVREELHFLGREQELGPIHLLKYVYLADFAYASSHGGETFTGARWRFYHYGPWEPEVFQRIEPAMKSIGANERHFASRYRDDVTRWSLREPGVADELERQLPGEVAGAVRRAVNEFGNDTAALLRAAYSTPPMLQATPGEALPMSAAVEPPTLAPPVPPPPAELKALSKTHLAKLKRRVQDRLAELKKQEADNPPLSPEPVYDEVFFAGRDWLDNQEGEPIEDHEGELVFDDSVWRSAARRDPKLP